MLVRYLRFLNTLFTKLDYLTISITVLNTINYLDILKKNIDTIENFVNVNTV